MKSEAYINGWFAHKSLVSSEANPYLMNLQPYSLIQWQTGWCDRFSACKHDGDLSLDNEV